MGHNLSSMHSHCQLKAGSVATVMALDSVNNCLRGNEPGLQQLHELPTLHGKGGILTSDPLADADV